MSVYVLCIIKQVIPRLGEAIATRAELGPVALYLWLALLHGNQKVGYIYLINQLNLRVHFWLHHTVHCAEKIVSVRSLTLTDLESTTLTL